MGTTQKVDWSHHKVSAIAGRVITSCTQSRILLDLHRATACPKAWFLGDIAAIDLEAALGDLAHLGLILTYFTDKQWIRLTAHGKRVAGVIYGDS